MSGDAHAQKFMRRTLDLLREKMETTGRPIASIVTKDGEIIAEGWNRAVLEHDPSLHAEVDAIRKACKKLQSRTLEGCDLYTTLEPCPMCATVIMYSKIRKVHYACREDYIMNKFDNVPPPCEQIVSAAEESADVIRIWAQKNPDNRWSRHVKYMVNQNDSVRN